MSNEYPTALPAGLRRLLAAAGEMTEQQRLTLPAELHQPHWDGLGEPHSWICMVCWGDGWQTSWPCAIATQHGRDVAEAGGMAYAW